MDLIDMCDLITFQFADISHKDFVTSKSYIRICNL